MARVHFISGFLVKTLRIKSNSSYLVAFWIDLVPGRLSFGLVRDKKLFLELEILFKLPSFRPLMIDLAGAFDQAAVAGRTFVGKHHLVHAMQQRGQHQDGGIHRRHRDVPVPRTLPVQFKQFRRDGAPQVERR